MCRLGFREGGRLGGRGARRGARAATLEDFELIAVLGRGGFGKVMQVRHRASGGVFAMKVFKKADLQRRNQVDRTRTERELLGSAATRHPFIVQARAGARESERSRALHSLPSGSSPPLSLIHI